MAVLNNFECAAHGIFEGFEAKCPHGCSKKFVKLVFLKPPATKSQRTRNIERETRALADDYKLRDIPTPEEGVSTMTKLGRTGQGVQWMDVPHGKAGTAASKFDISSLGADPGARPGLVPGMFKGPTPQFVNPKGS